MSINDETPVEQEADDLDTFSSSFFGQNEDPKEPASSKEVEIKDAPASDANEEDDTQDSGEDDTPATDEDEVSEEEEEQPEEAVDPKPKKNRFQERIDELTGKAREAERREQAALDRIAALESKLTQNEEPKPTPTVSAEAPNAPAPDDKNEDGTDKYPLGEFDPTYIRDLTKHTFAVEREAIKAQEEQEIRQKEALEQRQALQATWEEKLGPAQERYPDFLERGENLVNAFDGINPAYGEFLTATIMSLDYGPDVLYYLANNVDEAKKIVNSGATKATIALGRLEAKFAFAEEEKQKARPKVSKAPTPPAHLNKGSSAAMADVPADTDDLDAFASQFFTAKKRRS